MPFDSGQLNREHPFLFAQLQSSNDGTIVIGSGGRGSCELCHLNSPRGLAINQGYSTLAAARPHRIFTFADIEACAIVTIEPASEKADFVIWPLTSKLLQSLYPLEPGEIPNCSAAFRRRSRPLSRPE